MRIDPHLRRRQESIVVRAALSKTLSNGEILAAFARAQAGKIAERTITQYVSFVQDAMDYARDASGDEIHLSEWTRETVWEYIHHVEANYCRFFKLQSISWAPGAFCSKGRWERTIQVEEALRGYCGECPLFESSQQSIVHRLHALNRFFKFLVRSGITRVNFVRDIVSEYYEDLRQEGRKEKRRNPSVEEMVKLVNETAHPRNRAFYACSAKWWFRPNEMILLDRHGSLPGFEDGNDLVVLPDVKGKLDKRKGNRASVIDDELRPILEQYLVWWERIVQRDEAGQPKHTKLWITAKGAPLRFDQNFYDAMFYDDCLRLGLMTEEDKKDPLRRWTAHCQRHFGEKILMMNNCPDTWSKHFRGDVVKDARGQYFVPTPEQVREKYLEWVPKLGFAPLAQLSAKNLLEAEDRERAIHHEVLQEGIDRALRWKRPTQPFRCQRVVRLDWTGTEETVAYVPHTYLGSYLFALRKARPSERFQPRPDHEAAEWGRSLHAARLIRMFREAQTWINAT